MKHLVVLLLFVTFGTGVKSAPPACEPTSCGPYAKCSVVDHISKCACLENYYGNPYLGCRPECVTNADCSSTRACIQNKCEASMCAEVICDEHSGCVEANGKTSCEKFRDPVITNPCEANPHICQ